MRIISLGAMALASSYLLGCEGPDASGGSASSSATPADPAKSDQIESRTTDLRFAPGATVVTSGERINAGQRVNAAHGYYLFMQDDCNLVLYDALTVDQCGVEILRPGTALWSTGTNGKGPKNSCYAEMQTDGNLVVYTDNRRALWATGTDGKGISELWVQYDGNLVVYRLLADGNKVKTWARTNNPPNPGGGLRCCFHDPHFCN